MVSYYLDSMSDSMGLDRVDQRRFVKGGRDSS